MDLLDRHDHKLYFKLLMVLKTTFWCQNMTICQAKQSRYHQLKMYHFLNIYLLNSSKQMIKSNKCTKTYDHNNQIRTTTTASGRYSANSRPMPDVVNAWNHVVNESQKRETDPPTSQRPTYLIAYRIIEQEWCSSQRPTYLIAYRIIETAPAVKQHTRKITINNIESKNEIWTIIIKYHITN